MIDEGEMTMYTPRNVRDRRGVGDNKIRFDLPFFLYALI